MTDVEVIQTKIHPIVALRTFLDQRIVEIKSALPPHISPERFVRVVITAAQINPEIVACDRQSLWNACMRAANDGLLPDGREGAIVPFKGKATWMPMYGGLLKRFRNSGQFKWVTAGIVYEGEDYEHYISENGEHFRHVPGDDTTNKKIKRVYALATTKDGGSFITDMPIADIEKRRNMSRASRDDAPWKTWPHEMMLKTAIRVLSKYLPMSSDLDALIQRDEDAMLGVESVTDTRAALADRPSTQAALDHFGGETTKEVLQPETQSSDATDLQAGTKSEPAPERPAQAIRTAGAADAPHSVETAETSAASDDQQHARKLHDAFVDGQTARKKGLPRRSVPQEYDHGEFKDAWIDGWNAGGS